MRKLFRETAPRHWVSARALAVTICSVMVGPAMGDVHAFWESPSRESSTGRASQTIRAGADEPRAPVFQQHEGSTP